MAYLNHLTVPCEAKTCTIPPADSATASKTAVLDAHRGKDPRSIFHLENQCIYRA